MGEGGQQRQDVPEGTEVLLEDDLEPAGEATRGGAGAPSYSALDPRALLIGRNLGGFRVVRELASGGMASVFLARKEGPGRVLQHAAIKVVHPHLAFQRDFVDMFLDEARIVSCVHHPNVCRVLDFGSTDGTYYLAMEYVLGETWGAVASALAADEAGKKVLPALAAFVIAQACEGLHAAHEATDDEGVPLHIVHRDLSPQNIFVAYDGTVRVLDFGIARAADRITTTQAGTVKGRLAYMAPEQMEGHPVDRRADLWSLGVVLREALEGRRLFRRGSDAETMVAVTTDPIPPFRVPVAPKLQEIVGRALERDPKRRYENARQLGLDLTRFARAQTPPADMPELSAWMHRLFPAQLEEKRLMLQEQAPQARAVHPAPYPSQPAQSQALTPSAHGAVAASGEHSFSTASLGNAPAAQRGRGRSWGIAGLAAIIAAGAFAGVWSARRAQPDAPNFHDTHLVTKGAADADPQAPAAQAGRAELAPAADPQAPAPMGTSLHEGGRAATDRTSPASGAREDARGEAASDQDARAARRRQRRQALEQQDGTRAGAEDAAKTGTLVVACASGWAEVFLGERLLGTTPGRFSVPAGRHTLLVKKFGVAPGEKRTVDVPAGGTAKLLLQVE